MIYVDALRPCGAPWRSGVACHVVSDENVEELRSFAEQLGMPQHWIQQPTGANPHFDLSPRLRSRALKLGALACSGRELIFAQRRRRARAAAPPIIPVSIPSPRVGEPESPIAG
jgi:hypothetical protein